MTYQSRSAITPPEPMPVKLRVEDYLQLAETGAFDRYGKVELIDGAVIAMNAQRSSHSRIKSDMLIRLHLAITEARLQLVVDAEPTLSLPPHDMPEPNLMVLDATGVPPDGYYRIDNVKLLIEVSASTLSRDLGEKQQLYAEHGIPEYWVVDLNKARVHQFWGPDPDGYTQHRTVPMTGELRAVTVPELAIDGTGLI